jgi:hypothetical protein
MTETLSSQSWSNYSAKTISLNGEGFAETVEVTVSLVAKVTGGETPTCVALNRRQITFLIFIEQAFLLGASCCSLADFASCKFSC